MLNLAAPYSLLFYLCVIGVFASSTTDIAIYRIKGITYFQSDVDQLTQTFIQTKRCLKKEMAIEKYLGFSKFSTIEAKRNRQSLPLSKIVQYAAFNGSTERDKSIKSVFKNCLNDNNYKLLSAEYFLNSNKNYGLTKSEISRNLTHVYFKKTPTSQLWKEK